MSTSAISDSMVKVLLDSHSKMSAPAVGLQFDAGSVDHGSDAGGDFVGEVTLSRGFADGNLLRLFRLRFVARE